MEVVTNKSASLLVFISTILHLPVWNSCRKRRTLDNWKIKFTISQLFNLQMIHTVFPAKIMVLTQITDDEWQMHSVFFNLCFQFFLTVPSELLSSEHRNESHPHRGSCKRERSEIVEQENTFAWNSKTRVAPVAFEALAVRHTPWSKFSSWGECRAELAGVRWWICFVTANRTCCNTRYVFQDRY